MDPIDRIRRTMMWAIVLVLIGVLYRLEWKLAQDQQDTRRAVETLQIIEVRRLTREARGLDLDVRQDSVAFQAVKRLLDQKRP